MAVVEPRSSSMIMLVEPPVIAFICSGPSPSSGALLSSQSLSFSTSIDSRSDCPMIDPRVLRYAAITLSRRRPAHRILRSGTSRNLGGPMSELEALNAAVAELSAKVRVLEDHVALTQLVARYGPTVDSGSADATAALWVDDGVFEVVNLFTMNGRHDIAGMVNGDG